MRNSNAGFIVLLAKLGPKLFPILVKLHDALWGVVKSLFGVKTVGLAGSVGLYTYLFTWQMGVALVVFIAIHEYGHVWAMKRCGIKTKGMFFIPGFGAVAVAEERFGSARNEAYIAIMGPIFGLIGFVFPLTLIYYQTKEPMWAAIAALTAFINLVNLFPINPLDGGRILKALAYSERAATSLVIVVAVSVVTALVGTAVGFTLLGFMAIIGLFEVAVEFGIKDRVQSFFTSVFRAAVVLCFVGVTHHFFTDFDKHEILWLVVLCVSLSFMSLITFWDIKGSTVDKDRSVLAYPLVVLGTFLEGIKEIRGLRSHHISPIEGYDRMLVGGKVWYGTCFLGLVAIHVAVIYILGRVPGAELAKELLK